MNVIATLILSFGFITGAASSPPLVITNVTVIDVAQETSATGRTVIISGNRIIEVVLSSETVVPADAIVIEASGKFLIPGLWDMHVHTSSDHLTREIFLPLYVANGITGIRALKGDCFEPCGALEHPIGAVREWRDGIEAGRLVGPRIVAASPIIHGPEPGEPSSVKAPATEEHGRALARLLAERGVDFIKVYDELPRPAFHGLLTEAKRLGLPVAGHVPLEVPVTEAARAGMRSMEHLFSVIDECSTEEESQRPAVVTALREGNHESVMTNLLRSLVNFSVTKCAAVYEELARHAIWQVPTLVVNPLTSNLTAWRDNPALKYLPREELEWWIRSQASEIVSLPASWHIAWPLMRYRIELIAVDMHRAGVPILAGSDALAPGVIPGFGLHDELESLVRAGLTPGEALRAATLEPARYLKTEDSMGTIEAGKLADLVLLSADPLQDIRNTRQIEAVVADGRFYDRDALDGLLKKAEQSARQ